MKKAVLHKMRGKYRYNLIEVASSVAVLLGQFFAIAWLYFNDIGFGFTVVEGIAAVLILLLGCFWILKDILRSVIIEKDCILGQSLFGLCRQKIYFSQIENIRFGGISRGVKIDFLANGKTIRFVGNRRFFSALQSQVQKLNGEV